MYRTSSISLRVLGGVAAAGVVVAGLAAPASAAPKKGWPPAPTSVKGISDLSTSVKLTWKSGKGSTRGFNVYRGTSSKVSRTASNRVNKSMLTSTWIRNSGLASNKTYWFVVEAVGKGTKKTPAKAVAVKTREALPVAPKVTATAGDKLVKLAWTPVNKGGRVVNWSVYRATTATGDVVKGGSLVTRTRLPASARSFTDSGRTNGTTYRYVVVASNAGGTAASTPVSGTPSAPVAPAKPGVPTLTATAGNAQVALSWAATGEPTTSWSVYRSTSSPVDLGTATRIVNNAAAGTTTHTDTGRTNGTTYHYVVVATNAGGSTPSAEASAQPLAPAVPLPATPTLTATAGNGSVALAWAPGTGGGDVASWNVLRSTTSPVDPATATKVVEGAAAGTTSFTDTTVTNGTTYHYVVHAVNASGGTYSAERSASPVAPATPAELVISNPDGVPGSDRFVMSRMGYTSSPNSMIRLESPDSLDEDGNPRPTWYQVHDVATIRVNNAGGTAAQITGIASSNVLTFTTTVAAPITVPAGGSVDIPVRFVYTGGLQCSQAQTYGPMVCLGDLTISATGLPDQTVDLAGLWHPGPNRSLDGAVNFEPFLAQTMNGLFGFGTDIGSNALLDSNNFGYLFGDEVASRFWKAADPSAPVTVRRLVAHTAGVASVSWYPASNPTGCATPAEASCAEIAPISGPNLGLSEEPDPATAHVGQTVLPNPAGQATVHTFSPGTTEFGLVLDPGLQELIGFQAEFTDNTRNDTAIDVALHGCTPEPNCGHHIRFFPVKDKSGVVVPDTYIMAADWGGLNNDFQDNILMVSNVEPAR